uniref:Rubrerythrin n=1 Tax=Candidatus Kentrum eta TaxID=2126337 RepID=A0A450V4U0_9GAMM|nr:MAG: Rubrerythrin [Candidatus Kentron sp. H]VFJ99831.1 MAG: Rubrerythrin [Candidatus Kentron sp. H]VFK04270.1 MAG: Rubrerythrin [Candidatus Kentron sp. H]
MASKCPKCHQFLDEDAICCADIKYTWKCRDCGKLSTGFVAPYGRCFLCGGENEVIEGYHGDRPETVAIVKEAMQYELDMYHFYRLALARTGDEALRETIEDLYLKEQDHLDELEGKYHVHLDPELRAPSGERNETMAHWLFQGIDFQEKDHPVWIYDKAIEMERRTRDYFNARAEESSPGEQRETYRELAAEEEEHIALLETERAHITG